MEILNQFLFGDPEVQKAVVPLALAAPALIKAGAAALPGVIKAVGSVFGGGKRRREERAAQAAVNRGRQAYETFEFKDPSRNMTNPFEDLTINQQQAQFASQQQQQALAGTLGQLQGAAGSSGIAALAQSLAGQQSRNLQAASASIGQQEADNQMARARGQQSLESARATGEQYVQGQELARTQTLLGMDQQRLGVAKQARAAAKADLIGGISEGLGAAAKSLVPGAKSAAGSSAGVKTAIGGSQGMNNVIDSMNVGGQLASIQIPSVNFP
jgi:hypothetical protein